ncbi:MAG: 2Fe-2S iron-sulfur cluster binding domain-containing protein [Muribaculaceae bacterium]|nr:2Fe-2S iron-sulfur cluster binding domain-containing protein [Muribaculaceae bacterium]
MGATGLTVFCGVGFFLLITLLLVAVLLIAKKYLVKTGKVVITMNGDVKVEATSGKSLLGTMADNNVFLSSACGGKGSCGQCRLQVDNGGVDILPTE